MKSHKKITYLSATGALALLCAALFTNSSSAALVSAGLDCDNGGAVAAMGAIGCSGAWDGNDANQQADVLAQLATDFGLGTWSHTEKTNTGSSGTFFASVPASDDDTITFQNPIVGKFAIALKAADQFSLYLFDGGVAGLSSIDFITDGASTNPQGKAQNLSHASLYQVVPEPTTLALLTIGLVSIGLRRRY